ncbi:MAG: helix-turn-helix transcriptional regulator [Eubacterium sp.]|jgi:Predicted transcriptional regulators|nr:helix-turn-helix transcriptional regulator [Eubacterium sp.]
MNRLRQLRVERHLTQEELAFELDTTQQNISKIERQLTPMGEQMIIKSARFFGVTADYLLGISDVKYEIAISLSHSHELPDAALRDILSHYDSLNRPQRELIREIIKVVADFYRNTKTGDKQCWDS